MWLGCDQTKLGKEALQEIIKRDINITDDYVWCECSGVIEHWFKKHEGFPVPNVYVENLLDKTITLGTDEFHYSRLIGQEQEEITKVIFRFASEDLANKVISEFNDYERKRINFISDSTALKENYNPSFTSLEVAAMNFIENIEECTDTGLNELTQILYNEIKKAINILKPCSNERISKIYINRAQWILDNKPLLEIKKF